MNTFLKRGLFFTFFVCLPHLLLAQTSVVVDGLNYRLNTNGEATLTGRESTSTTEIYIPATITYNDVVYPVTAIGNYAFSGGDIDYEYSNIAKVTFETPSNVVTIGKCAFYGASFGTRPRNGLVIPGSVKTIEEGAFCWCGMSSIVIEEGVEKIGKAAFYDCRTDLTSVTFPLTLKSIAPYAFMHCYKLTSITLPEGLKSIGSFAFAYGIGLKELHMPSTLEYFGNSVLYYNYSLSDITIQPNCQYFTMGEGNEKGIIFNKDKTRLIFYSAEQQLLGRRYQYKVPTHVKEIGGGAFSAVGEELRSIVLPSTLELIDSFAFARNPLERITIPAHTRLLAGALPKGVKEIYVMGNQGPAQITEGLKPVTLYPGAGLQSGPYGGRITAVLYTKESLLPTYSSLAGATIGSSKITAVSSEIPATAAKRLTTLCRDFDVDLTNETLANGVKAYIATEAKKGSITELDGNEFSGTYMVMKPIDYIPSRTGDENDDYTGVVIMAEPGTNFTYKMGENDCFSSSQITLDQPNLLEGAPCYMHVWPTESDDDKTYRCFGLNNGRFKSYSAEGTLSWNKAYLRIPNDYIYGAKEIVFSFEEEEDLQVTGISTLEKEQSNDIIYDLQGRRLSNKEMLKPGIYIIKGKKVIVK